MHANPVEPADWAAIEIRAARLANEVISSRRRRRVLIWTRQTAIAAISQLTGLPEWEISERKFRLQWRLTFWWRETYIRRISPLLKDPFGWLHRAIFRVLVPLSPPPDLDERLFRVRWNIYHACLSFYRRRISATCLAPFAYARRRIARMQASKLPTLRKSSSSSKTPGFVMSARQVRTAERRKNRIRRQRKGIESQA
jgi:hypothetical protein